MEKAPTDRPKRRTRQNGAEDPIPSTSGLLPPKHCRKEPLPNLAALYAEFNRTYFDNTLHSFVIQWSSAQTHCSGITFPECRIISISCRIIRDSRMSHDELVDIVLHEMIHVYLFQKIFFFLCSCSPTLRKNSQSLRGGKTHTNNWGVHTGQNPERRT